MIFEKLGPIIAVVCSLIVSGVFLRMSFSYTHRRACRKFAKGKLPAPSLKNFRTLSKLLFISSMCLTLISYWQTPNWLLSAGASPLVQIVGASLVLVGYLFLQRSFHVLGENYSPLFDAYFPFDIVTTGAYRLIRHPIYLYNLFVSFGLAVSSLSLIVFINATIGLSFVIKAIALEEQYLDEHFAEYAKYSAQSWRLIPYIY